MGPQSSIRDAGQRFSGVVAERHQSACTPWPLAAGHQLGEHDGDPAVARGVADVVLAGRVVRGGDDELARLRRRTSRWSGAPRTSEPCPVSVIAKQPSSSPEMIAGRYAAWCGSVPSALTAPPNSPHCTPGLHHDRQVAVAEHLGRHDAAADVAGAAVRPSGSRARSGRCRPARAAGEHPVAMFLGGPGRRPVRRGSAAGPAGPAHAGAAQRPSISWRSASAVVMGTCYPRVTSSGQPGRDRSACHHEEVIENPFGYPRQRGGWPSWVIVVVSLVAGVALAGGSTAAFVGIATSDHDTTTSGSAANPVPDPGPSSADPGTSGSDRLSIDFPDGASGTFTLPAGLEHDADNDDDGHVAIAKSEDDGPYLDVYTDETTGSLASDLREAAAQEASSTVRYGGKTGPITYRTIAGHRAGQFRVAYTRTGHPPYDALVTVLLEGKDMMSLYWADRVGAFSSQDGQRAESSVLQSLRIDNSTNQGSSGDDSPSA